MKIVRDGLWLCIECVLVAVNGDASGLDFSYPPDEAAQRLARIEAGLTALGPMLVTDFDSETGDGVEEEIGAYVTRRPCDCCGSPLHGSRHRFAILG